MVGTQLFLLQNKLDEEGRKPFLIICEVVADNIETDVSKNGGKIILFSTESALHSANPTSLGYGVAKAGIECLTKALAKEGAQNNILVNCIRPGFINSGFHERWQGKTQEDLNKRIEYIPLKKAGTPGEVSAMIAYLLSDWGNFITGQSIGITGGN